MARPDRGGALAENAASGRSRQEWSDEGLDRLRIAARAVVAHGSFDQYRAAKAEREAQDQERVGERGDVAVAVDIDAGVGQDGLDVGLDRRRLAAGAGGADRTRGERLVAETETVAQEEDTIGEGAHFLVAVEIHDRERVTEPASEDAVMGEER